MTAKRKTTKKPSYQVVPAEKRNLMQHDIVLLADMLGFKIYIDPEIQIVLKHIIQEYGRVAVKINWGSPDLQLFVEPSLDAQVDTLVEMVYTEAQDTAVESEETEA